MEINLIASMQRLFFYRDYFLRYASDVGLQFALFQMFGLRIHTIALFFVLLFIVTEARQRANKHEDFGIRRNLDRLVELRAKRSNPVYVELLDTSMGRHRRQAEFDASANKQQSFGVAK
ncbi:hypothetical protein M3Y98_00183800 [Aphelenchoides besseyi]|nr:hypothetical protein M3Y98_00183800 [Aphelenchoides besseyi]KAI6200143.1 hypothetical protein M3Y96_00701700 [Aphelenchoides besseyi]